MRTLNHTAESEKLDANAIAELQDRKLRRSVPEITATNSFYGTKFSELGDDPFSVPFEKWPFTTRNELQLDQAEHPPYGTNLTHPLSHYTRLHQTSGSSGSPIRWLDTPESWAWWGHCWSTIYHAAGVTKDDRLAFPFSFGPFIGFWGAFEAAAALGVFVLPCGGMTTVARLHHILDHGSTVICCTPTYALRLAEVAQERQIDLAGSSVRALIVAGEPGGSIPATRRRIEQAWGGRVFDHAGMTEMGPWGYECVESPGGLHVMESEFIAEIIDPETRRPMPAGERGELVLTNLGRIGQPLIRYRTGDEASLSPGTCACGRSFQRIEGGLRGRLDDMLIVRGNNVFPSAIEGILREMEDVGEFRITLDETGVMSELRLEVEQIGATDGRIEARVCQRVQDRLHFKPAVVVVERGTLPRFELKSKRVQK